MSGSNGSRLGGGAPPAPTTMLAPASAASVRDRTGDVAVDVLVATRNRPADLRRFLTNITDLDHHRFRLVILDQSDDPAPNRQAVEELDDDRVTHVVHPRRGKSKALNDGLRMTRSEFIAFTDDDCDLPAEWLSQALAAMLENPQAGLLFGNVEAFPHDPQQAFVPAVEFDVVRSLAGPLTRSPGLLGMGANMMIRRSALRQAGSFDEDLGPGGRMFTGEDVELAYRMLRSGFEVLQDPTVVVIHRGARPVAGGAATDAVNTAFFAIGCGYGKHVRGGDRRALRVAADELVQVVSAMSTALLTRQRPLHLRRLLSFLHGFLRGIAAGPRRERRDTRHYGS